MVVSTEKFWDSQWDGRGAMELSSSVARAVNDAIAFFGNMRGKRVLDIGCGNGGTSLLLATGGGHVVGLDMSSVAVDNVNRYVARHGVENVAAICADAMHIDRLGKFDFIFGSLILHHLEPFADFCAVLRNSLAQGGRGFFFENSAASDLLIWFREHLVGKFGVPRYGDGVESPLSTSEVCKLREYFAVDIQIPEMVFVQLASTYLLKRKFQKAAKAIDDMLYRLNIGTQYSYRQYVLLKSREAAS